MIYFFSDVHLGLGSKKQIKKSEEYVTLFLKKIVIDKAEKLFIVGDLFDYWFEYNHVIPKHFTRILGTLAMVVDSGVEVEYVIGNHDFGHKNYFENELGIKLHYDDITVELYEKKFYISHGDGKAFNDKGYLILKKLLRSRLMNSLYRFIHPDIGIGFASYLSRRSRGHTNLKDYSINSKSESDGLLYFATNKIIKEGYDFVIMGHNHKSLNKKIGYGNYINLGEWISERSYLVLDENGFKLEKFM